MAAPSVGGPVPVSPSGPPWWQALQDRWCGWRDRRVADPGFQRRAAAFWLTRPFARRRARQVFDLVAGFVYSQVLQACVRLGLLERLAEAPQTAAQLAPRLGLTPAAAERLLEAARALQLVARRSGGRYGLGPLGAPLVGQGAIQAMVRHHAALYADLADPVALLQGPARAGQVAATWAYAGAGAPQQLDADRVAAYSELMAASQPLVAEQILASYPFERHRHLLDVGGGDGRFVVSAAQRCPDLQATLFDLPAVARRARQRFLAAGLASRLRAVGGSFLGDPLPTGADLVTLVRVVHDHDDAAAMGLLRAVRQALPAGGRLLLAEPMADTPGAEPMGGAYFGFYLLAMGQGRPRAAAELTAMLQAAGFAQVRPLRTALPLQTSLLLALA